MRSRPRLYVPLFWRLFVPNAVVLGAACVVLIVEPANGRVVALVGGLVTMLAVNVVLMRRAFVPLERLARLMRQVDPLRPGQRLELAAPGSEVTVLAESFDEMLDRLEAERRESAQRATAAQEDERRRLAGELHDELGQSLTALVLQLDHSAEHAEPSLQGELLDARAKTLALVESTRALARRLRPEALDVLGLSAALTNLTERLSAQTGLMIERDLPRILPPLDAQTELVLYRIAQESLTNVVRHAKAQRVQLALSSVDDHIVLRVTDDGIGYAPGDAGQGGIRFMRERALLVGAELSVDARPGEPGTEVRLSVPLEQP